MADESWRALTTVRERRMRVAVNEPGVASS